MWRGLFVNESAEICCPPSWSLSWAAICTTVSPPRCLIMRQLRRLPFLMKCLLLCFCGDSRDGFCVVRLLQNSIGLYVCVRKRRFVSCSQPELIAQRRGRATKISESHQKVCRWLK
ncbi:unnamed protein product [Ixodes pacificus]